MLIMIEQIFLPFKMIFQSCNFHQVLALHEFSAKSFTVLNKFSVWPFTFIPVRRKEKIVYILVVLMYLRHAYRKEELLLSMFSS